MGTSSIGVGRGESGTRVDQVDASTGGVATPFGVTGIVGAFEWGPVNEPVLHSGKPDYLATRGNPLREDEAAVACEHFFAEARGAGRLITVRLADGAEAQSQVGLYGRDVPTTRKLLTPAGPPTHIATVKGLYPGRRGGQTAALAARSADLGAAANWTAGTFTTGVAMEVDRWKDALLSVTGISRTYKVLSNNSAGVLVVEVPAGDTEPAGAGTWSLLLDAARYDGRPYGLAVQVGSSQGRPGTETSLKLYDRLASTRSPAKVWASLGFDDTLDSYADAVNVDAAQGRQALIALTDEGNVTDPSDDAQRPANMAHAFTPASGVANTGTLLTWYWERSGTGTGYVDPDSIAYGTVPMRCKAVCTFTAATDADVQFFTWEGTPLSEIYTGAADLALGTLFDAGAAFLPKFTLRAGADAFVAQDEVVVYFDPLPSGMKNLNGILYPHAHDGTAGDVRLAHAITGNTTTTVTVDTDIALVADDGVVMPTAPSQTSANGDPLGALAGGETFKYQVSGEAATTLTHTLGAGVKTLAAIRADLEAQEAVAHPANPRVVFSIVAGKLVVAAKYDFGANATLKITDGSLNPILGFVNDTTTNGTDGTVAALGYAQNLLDGTDGTASLATADYQAAFDISTSPMLPLLVRPLGLVKWAMPGVSDASAQNSAIAYCDEYGYAFRGELPSNIASEADAVAWIVDNLTGSENLSVCYDSHGYPSRRPFPGPPALYSLSGALLGMEARLARDNGGYHVAAAGASSHIGTTFPRLASDDLYTSQAPRKATGTLNPGGVQAVNHEGAQVYVFGDRSPADAYAGTVWKHKVETRLHLMHELARLGDPFVFNPPDLITRELLAQAVSAAMEAHYRAGWFARTSESTFENTVLVNTGDDVNTLAVQAVGELRATVTITTGIIGTAERVVFALGTGGVAVVEQ